ncbi:MAG: hypothetical protein GWM98_04605 [Nitrospinaceae bacterium]|nr:hypothetical protein [Deltaproteobacteria bacterium]NIY14200.1 hypothetical protein [Nitrospinaceae bacterium]
MKKIKHQAERRALIAKLERRLLVLQKLDHASRHARTLITGIERRLERLREEA